MKPLKYLLPLVLFSSIAFQLFGQSSPITPEIFHIGADLSMTKAILDKGGVYYVDNQEVDVFEAFKNRKYDYARLRLFHSPNGENGQVNTLDYTIELAKTIKASGLKLMLDFHYSDSWADPSQQTKPVAWADLDFTTLNDSLYTYTKNVLNLFAENDIYPDLVQTGNEIHHGMLWPDGQIWVDGQPNWEGFTTLLKSAIKGVRDSNGGDDVPIMVHGFESTDSQQAKNYMDNLVKYNVNFDLIGLSYYICWGGPMDLLDNTLNFLDATYDQDIIIAETNYNSDGITPEYCVVDDTELPFPYTEQGQYDYLQALYALVKKYPSTKGLFYWGGELIWAEDIGGSWKSLFHWQGNALKALDAFYDLLPVEESEIGMNRGFRAFRNHHDMLEVRSSEPLQGTYDVMVYDNLGRIINRTELKSSVETIHLTSGTHGFMVVRIYKNGVPVYHGKLIF